MLETELQRHRNPELGVPYSYLIRQHEEVTPAVRDIDYHTTDDQLVATVELSGKSFKADTQKFWDALKPSLIGGAAWPFVEGVKRMRDGRKAWLQLQAQAEGLSAKESRLTKANRTLETVSYNGRSRFSIEKYIEIHQKAHNTREQEGVVTLETEKVRRFLDGIKDPKLESVKNVIKATEKYRTNFTECQLFIKDSVKEEHGSSEHAGRPSRGIGGVRSTTPKKGKGSGSKTQSGSRRDRKHPDNWAEGVFIGTYDLNEWKKLDAGTQAKIRRLRETLKPSKKQKTSQVASAMQIPGGMDSGTFTAPDGRQVTFQISSVAAAAAAPAPATAAAPMDLTDSDCELDAETTAIHREIEQLDEMRKKHYPSLHAVTQQWRDPKFNADHAKYLAAKAKSAGSQFGRHNQRERKETPQADKTSKPASLEVAGTTAGVFPGTTPDRKPSVGQK